jgi:hypothetical protein
MYQELFSEEEYLKNICEYYYTCTVTNITGGLNVNGYIIFIPERNGLLY